MLYPPKDLSLRFGALTDDGFTIVVMSRSSDVVTISCDAFADLPVTMGIFGDGRSIPDAGGESHVSYYGTITITGLDELALYTVTGTQGSFTDVIYPRTKTSRRDAHIAIAPVTCMAPSITKSANGPNGKTDAYFEVTSYDFYKTYIDDPSNPPLLAATHFDDIYYADGSFGIEAATWNNEGKTTDPGDSVWGGSDDGRAVYSWSLLYAIWFGLFSEFYNLGTDPDKTKPLGTAAMNESVQYCLARMGFMPQVGDHEFYNNCNWKGDPNGNYLTGIAQGTDRLPNALHATANGFDGKGWTVYKEIMRPLQGTPLDGIGDETNGNGWYCDFGPMRMISPDGTTFGSRDWDNDVQVAVYGNTQINYMLQLGEDEPKQFTVVGNSATAGRGFPQAFKDIEGYPGYKNENWVIAEYNMLWLTKDNTPRSLMDNPYTNGLLGQTVMFRGDSHYACAMYWSAPETATEAKENFYEFGLRTVDNSAVGTRSYKGVDFSLLVADNCRIESAVSNNDYSEHDYTSIDTKAATIITKPYVATATIVEVDGTKPTPEMIVKVWEIYKVQGEPAMDIHFYADVPLDEYKTDWKGNIWKLMSNKTIPVHGGNEGFNPDEEPFQLTSGSTSASD